MMLLKPKVGGSTGKGPGEIVACGASWHVVFDDGLMQLAARRATRPESFVLTPPRGEPLRRPPSRPTPAHPTQAWAMEGAGSAETADPTGAARVATLHGPHPPRPPVRRFRSPLETGSRPPGPPPSTAHPRRFPHRPTAPATRSIYSLVWEEKTRRPRLRQTQAVYCPPNRGRSSYPPELGRFVRAEPLPAVSSGSAASQWCEETYLLDKAPFNAHFQEVTGVSTYLGTNPAVSAEASDRQLDLGYEVSRYKVSVWDRLSSTLVNRFPEGLRERSRLEVEAGFLETSPEEVNLAFNEVTSLRDFVNVLLGGSSSRWTNVQLAESLSRLVTARRVEASFVSEVLPRPRPIGSNAQNPLPERLVLADGVRKAVLEGMERVVTGQNGTGHELRGALRSLTESLAHQGRQLRVYSKTGSPVIEHGVPGELGPVLHNLVDHFLVYRGDQIGFRSEISTASYPDDAPAFREALASAVQRLSHRAGLPSQIYRVLTRFYSRRECLSWNGPGDPPVSFDSPVFVAGGKLRFNPRSHQLGGRAKTFDGAIYMFSLVSLPASTVVAGVPDPEQLSSPDARVITVALHLEAGPTSKLAVRAAARLLGDLEPLLR
jgi:hypothetical protein